MAIPSRAEKCALYGLILMKASNWSIWSLTSDELALATSCPGILAQIYCILQTSYFKAKHAFFHFLPKDVESDFDFVIQRYFR